MSRAPVVIDRLRLADDDGGPGGGEALAAAIAAGVRRALAERGEAAAPADRVGRETALAVRRALGRRE
jgi:hypothetical protein